MNNVLLRLVDRNNVDVRHDPLHVDLSFSADDIKRYLNSVFRQDRNYRFYMNNMLFDGSLMDEVNVRGLETERGLSVQYEADEDLVPDCLLELQDCISFMRVTRNEEDEIWCGMYGGMLSRYRYKDGLKLVSGYPEHCGSRGIAFGDRTYVYNASGEIVDLSTAEVLFRIGPDQVTCIESSGNIVSVGTSAGKCFVFVDKLEKVHEFRTEITSIGIRDRIIEFTSLDGCAGAFSAETGVFEERRMEHPTTSMDFNNGMKILGTSCSVLVEEGRSSLKTNIRFSIGIAIYDDDFVAQASQYVVSVVNIRNSTEIRRITLEKPISGVAWVEKTLFISTGSQIRGYSMSEFLRSK